MTPVNTFGESTDSANAAHTYPPHVYDGLVYVSGTHGGGANGSLVRIGFAGSGFRNALHRFDLTSLTGAPKRVVDTLLIGGKTGGSYPAATEDHWRGGAWITDGGLIGPLQFVRYSDWAVLSFPAVNDNLGGNFNLVYLPPPYDLIFAIGNVGTYFNAQVGYRISRIVNNVPQPWQAISVTGTPPKDTRVGADWSTLLSAVVSYEGAGANVVRKLTPPAASDVASGTWTWTSETLAGVNGATPAVWRNVNGNIAENGVWSRFKEVPALRCFIFANSMNGPVQAWRLAGM